jgi:hypothetical protein
VVAFWLLVVAMVLWRSGARNGRCPFGTLLLLYSGFGSEEGFGALVGRFGMMFLSAEKGVAAPVGLNI